jgi:hypothetical protein
MRVRSGSISSGDEAAGAILARRVLGERHLLP